MGGAAALAAISDLDGDRLSWFPDWSGSVCALIASGPSVNQDDVNLLKGLCRVGCVNNNYQLAPWADVLYAADGKWWDAYPEARKFSGLKVTPDAAAAKRYGLNVIELLGEIDTDKDRIIVDRPSVIARGGNSAFQLVNLAALFGSKRQIWIGFDFQGAHWHDDHPSPLRNPRQQTLTKWRDRLDRQATVLHQLGIEVINASMVSELTAYPKMTVREALTKWT